jgi:curved DNA-binding protein CbpA
MSAHLKPNDLERTLKIGASSESLSSEEAFVLSRLSSPLKLKELLNTLPWTQDESRSYIAQLLEKGHIEWDGANLMGPKVEELSHEWQKLLEDDERHPVHQTIDKNFRIKILEQIQKIKSDNPFEILGVETTSSDSQIKARYMELSREFHPDRFFRKNLGDYAKRLNQIFSKIQKAYTSIKNPHDREVFTRKHRKGTTSHTTSIEELKQKDPLLKKIANADQHFKQGLEAQKKGEVMAAYNEFLLAVQLNPKREEFKRYVELIKPLVMKEKAKDAIQRAENLLSISLFEDALREIRSALRADPENGKASLMAAKILLEIDEKINSDEAQHLLKKAKIKCPTDPEPCLQLAQIYQMQRSTAKARAEIHEALRRDPDNAKAKNLLNKL